MSTDLVPPGTTYAEANHGRWVARCARPWCPGAESPGLLEPEVFCTNCGFVSAVVWPADPEAIEAILLLRPVPQTRNWLVGETLQELLEENVAHGVVPPEWLELADAAPGRVLSLLEAHDEKLTGGVLLAELEARRMAQIGA